MFRTLSGGRGGIGRSQTERHQRGRLEGAMVEAVSRHGYAETTVAELVGLAGVSKSTFYAHFASKEECFFATFETIVAEVSARVGLAYRSESGLEGRLAAAFTRFVEIVDEESAAAALVVVDALSLGAPAVPYLEHSTEVFELIIRQSFQQEPAEVEPSDLTLRAIVAGIRTVVYRCLRAGSTNELCNHLEPILSWLLCYRSTVTVSPPIERPPSRPATGVGSVPWSEPPDSPRSREVLTQRERIIRAAALLSAERSYAQLTIPAISGQAGTSNQTFYEHFESKEQAFIAAFDQLADRALMATLSASGRRTNWWAAVEAGFHGLLEHIVAEPLFARLAFFELPAAGPTALDHADAAIGRFLMFLQPELLPSGLSPLPPLIVEAIGGGIWEAIKHELVAGNLESLPEISPEIAAIALTPLRTA
jgi:AcrR family transcriptional regulator